MIIKNVLTQKNFALKKQDLYIKDGKIAKISDCIDMDSEAVYDMEGCMALPGAIDVHVHLREPGFAAKETVKTGTMSAAKGGVTTVMAMPNLNPVPDSIINLNAAEDIIRRDAAVNVYQYASVTKGENGKELSDIAALSQRVKAFSDDGKGVNNLALLEQAMKTAKETGSIICSHAEAENFGTKPEAETVAVEREIELVRKTGCRYHFCHLSVKKSFELVKAAKREGLDITAESAPHHLFLTENDIKGRTNYKMNPPLRKEEDRQAAIEALLDGTVSMIATDHAPHTEEEKALPYDKAPNGIIGLETLIPLVYTKLVKTGKANVSDMINWLTINPARRFSLPYATVEEGQAATFCVIDTVNKRRYTKEEILSKGKNSPFIGEELYGFCRMTVLNGNIVFLRGLGGKKI